MEKNMLVLVLDPEDPQVFDLRQPAAAKPTFGIVREVGPQSGSYLGLRCTVQHNDKTTEILPVGRLVSLLVLPEEDTTGLTPTEAFSKWAPEIVKRQSIVHLPKAQYEFLAGVFPKEWIL